MRNKLLLLIGLFMMTCVTMYAQLSNEQVLIEARRLHESGMSQTEIIQELTRKGVTAVQLQRLREAWESQASTMSLPQVHDTTQGIRTEIPVTTNVVKSSDSHDKRSDENRVFGYDFFSQSSLTFAPSLNMPTPANYVLGPGDEIIIDVWGDSELNLTTVIAPDGYITVSGLGRIEISGMSVERATARIKSAFANIYSDLDSPNPYTFIGVSVGNTRTIKVNVMGEVVKPGTYTLTSFATAFHALYSAGGPNRLGSLRSIEIFRDGKPIERIDLYDYLMKGNSMNDISLRDGDIVKVNPYGTLAKISGHVKRPMRYEMLPNETLYDLIQFAGGFSGKAFRRNLQVDRNGDDGMESFTVNDSQYAYFSLKDGDVITVGNILDEYSNAITIEGAVRRPGKYAIGSEVQTLKDLVNIAQGPTGDAYMYRALLYRENEDLTITVESIDLAGLMSNRLPDIQLKKNDRLFVPSVLKLDEKFTVYVGGEVRHPGEYLYADNLSIEDIILRAGGLNEAASTARVNVYRRIKDPSSTVASEVTSETFTFSLENGLMTTEVKDFILKPYDQIVVRRSPSYHKQEIVYVEGEVLFTGQYAKKSRDERISSLVNRAGGIKEKAYVKGARLKRRLTAGERERMKEAVKTSAKIEQDSTTLDKGLSFSTQYVGIDLEKAMKNPGSDDDIVLREGDVLIIPPYTGTVKISGGVLYPNTVTYKRGLTISDYIDQAGGFSRLAMKRKPYVVYMNGHVATGRWAKVEPGCEIVVPEKPDREPLSAQAIMGLSTSAASIAMLLINIFR